ncbi:hypothetical protein D049_4657A, partial [Vibrio parahaemolyticus VPTS-2010]
MEQTLSL